jgi:hypothetical protein
LLGCQNFTNKKRKGTKNTTKEEENQQTKSRGEIANKQETIQKGEFRVHLRVYITTEG